MGWCKKYADRWPTSLVNKQARMLYYGVTSIGGLVLAPEHVSLFCAYSGDGNSMARLCDPLGGDGSSCIPGCSPAGSQCQELGTPFGCSYDPAHLGQVNCSPRATLSRARQGASPLACTLTRTPQALTLRRSYPAPHALSSSASLLMRTRAARLAVSAGAARPAARLRRPQQRARRRRGSLGAGGAA